MMQQYLRIKAEHPDAILLFRMGDFYETFLDDAVTISRVLGITLTSRNREKENIPLAGVPHHAVDGYIKKLVAAGYRVAVCDQLEDPKQAKGLVDRGITRVITAGTLTDDLLPDERSNNYLAAVCAKSKLCGISWVDLSTGRFFVEEVEPDRLTDELARIGPAECLYPEGLAQKNARLARDIAGLATAAEARPDWVFERRNAEKTLFKHFGVGSLEGFGCGGLEAGISAAGAVLDYLNETQRTSLAHIDRIERFDGNEHLLIDRATKRSLELVETMRGGERRCSLLWAVDRTVTTMGARLLQEWILSPLRSVPHINARQGAVAEFCSSVSARAEVRAVLSRVADVERIASKISTARANARDLVALRRAAAMLPELSRLAAERSSELSREIAERLDPLEDISSLIARALVEEPPAGIREGGMIRRGYNTELDELRAIQHDGKSWIARYQAEMAKKTGIDSLRVGFNSVFGYYIEVTHTHSAKVPAEFTRKQTLKNAERYITPELKEYETKVLTAGERADQIEYDLFIEVRDKAAAEVHRIIRVGRAMAELDVIAAFAELAAERRYCRPIVDDSCKLLIKDGRHPVIEQLLEGESFVPNDSWLDGEEQTMAIITGPNMAGKSTYIRQVALTVLLAQVGSFVPARSAEIGVCDRIFARVGASDEISRAQSTFMVEMNETANILNNASARSLIVLDEVGRGTSTYDGVSIAWAVSEYIHEKLGARTLFATHYHELTALEAVLPKARNYNVAVREWEDEVIFLRKIIEGGTDKSYGLHVAKLAGIPKPVVERAKKILAQLEASNLDENDQPRIAPVKVRAKKPHEMQMSLFRSPHESTIDAIKKIDADTLTPLEALLKLQQLKKEILDRERGA